jgi:hypothetical protein
MPQKLHAPRAPHATHEHQVFHERYHRKSAELVKRVAFQENALIAVRQAEPPNA